MSAGAAIMRQTHIERLLPRTLALLRSTPVSVPLLLSGVLVSLVVGAAAFALAQQDAHQTIEDHLGFAQIAIKQRLREYGHALDGMAALLAAGPVDGVTFRRSVDRLDLLRRYPGIRAVAVVERVPGAAHLQIESVDPAHRFASLLRSELARLGSVSDKAHLALLRTSAVNEYLLALPVYRTGSTGSQPHQRRADFVGLVCALLHTPDIFRLHGLLDPITLAHLRMRLIDDGRVSAGALPAARYAILERGPAVARPWHFAAPRIHDARHETRRFVLGGRHFELQLTALDGLSEAVNAVFPWVVLLGSIVTTLLLSLVVGSLAASRRRAEALTDRITSRLRESQESLLEAQHIARLGNWSYDCAARRMDWSEELYCMAGLSSRQRAPTYRECVRRLHPLDQRTFRALVRASLCGGQGYETDVRLRDASGGVAWLHVVSLPMVDEFAQVVFVRGTAMDITERKRIELRKSAEHNVMRLLASGESLAEIAPRVIETVCATFAWACGVFWEWRRDGLELVRGGAWSMDDRAIAELDALASSAAGGHENLLRRALDAGRAVASEGDNATRAGVVYAVPILAGEQLVGGVEFLCREGCVLDEDQVALLHAMAAQIGQFHRRNEAEQALRASEERLHGIVHSAIGAIITVDHNQRIVLFNPAAEKLFGYSATEALGAPMETLIPARLRELHASHMRGFEASGETVRRMGESIVVSALRRNGEEFPVEASIAKMTQGGQRLYTVILNDITARRRDAARLEFLANYDALTALPNRSLFAQRLHRALQHAQRFDRRLAVLFIDLDRFKNINDTLGHDSGDEVLREVAVRLVHKLRESDTVARLGGDEFVVLLEGVEELHDVAVVAQKLLDTLAEPYALHGREYHVTASIGISAHPLDAEDGQTLLKNADIAMYRAKEQGKNNFQFYAAHMNVHSVERLTLEADLRHAVKRTEFVLHYQPKIDLTSGQISSVEALVRWMHPKRGMILPAQFIPIAEETGLIVPIGEWVLQMACARSCAWRATGLPPLRVAVNLSARQFARTELARDVARVLGSTGLDPAQLELEITESMVMANPEQSVRTLRELKAMGVILSIDDFGTGYSSLAYLKRFPIDLIKVDRSFVQDIPSSADDVAITKTIIAMARSLRLRVIAEGVETEAQYEFLREEGCDEMQGYYFSRPLVEEAMLALYRAQCEASELTLVASQA